MIKEIFYKQLSNEYFITHDSPKVPKQYVTHYVNTREAALITDIAAKRLN